MNTVSPPSRVADQGVARAVVGTWGRVTRNVIIAVVLCTVSIMAFAILTDWYIVRRHMDNVGDDVARAVIERMDYHNPVPSPSVQAFDDDVHVVSEASELIVDSDMQYMLMTLDLNGVTFPSVAAGAGLTADMRHVDRSRLYVMHVGASGTISAVQFGVAASNNFSGCVFDIPASTSASLPEGQVQTTMRFRNKWYVGVNPENQAEIIATETPAYVGFRTLAADDPGLMRPAVAVNMNVAQWRPLSADLLNGSYSTGASSGKINFVVRVRYLPA